ncbi:NAD-dependent succinate-semialdehyde dehydrogenase [Microlunatus sp. Gsoil 973]|uniref:NAD-dependent succinate-semialdehyde dehydrogenase n=1 Tax=Microlunatus sp. Gsoil 973 TaxID=2672569 RepID=UPI0012B4FE19|nr:NAD-dependent succinate-semialdehyde dehydrogenase [Microlunatus sp. Gsoil 973]QGN31586.1 aldehyde dehydrogenase family protein [Microlunatus sp. Gsoil 973]
MTEASDLLYIGGEWTSGHGGTIDLIDPSTEAVIAKVAAADKSDVDSALAAAEAGFEVWRSTDAWTRSTIIRSVADLVRRRADEIGAVMSREQGKPVGEAIAEVKSAADQFDWFADEARRIYGRTIDGHSRGNRLFAIHQPVGPVAAFTAWNFPALLPARKMAAAMAAGCSMVIKPAEEAPQTALCLAQACHDAGVPAGVINMLVGDPALISERLIDSGSIRKISLTGSVPVGRQLLRQAADRIIPTTLELGGHAPVLVFDDVDVSKAAEMCARTKFRNCGQVCISPSRFFVQESVADQFAHEVTQYARGLKIGSGVEPGTDVGPLTNARRLAAVEALVTDAVDRGAAVTIGGRRPPGLSRGYFYEPTVLTGVTTEMDVMHQEPFGPILPIATFSDVADGVALANATPYGLAGYVFTDRTRLAFEVSEALEVGMVGVNNMVIATAEAPFGGIKDSGFGREGGAEGIEPYLVTKYVNIAI